MVNRLPGGGLRAIGDGTLAVRRGGSWEPLGAALVPVGISTGQYIATLPTQAAAEAYLDACVDVGAAWIREAIVWPTVQPANSSTFDWTRWDLFASLCAARGLRLCVNVGGSPAWARPTTSGLGLTAPPDNPATFGTFCAAVAARNISHWGGAVKHWEVWNEPNQAAYWGGTTGTPNDVDPAEYTAVLAVAYDAFKAADPSCIVLGGSFTPSATGMGPEGYVMSPPVFLEGMMAAGAGPKMDGVAHHPYSYPVNPEYPHADNAWWQMENTTPSLQSVLEDYGYGHLKFWLTEYGAPTDGIQSPLEVYVSEADQATLVDDAIRLARARPEKFGFIGIFTGADRAAAGSHTTREEHFGVLRPAPGFALKPAGTAMLTAITDTGGPG